MKKLTYNDELHEYRITDEDGVTEIVPSVTEIASKVTGKDFSRVPAADLLAAQERGKAIHKDVESRDLETPEGKWIATHIDLLFFRSEVSGWAEIDGQPFAGTCDLLSMLDLIDEVEIDDIKSEAGESRLYWTIQLALYRAILAPDSPVRHYVFAVPKTGNFARIPIAVLPEAKVREVIAAYKEGRILDDTFLNQAPQIEAPAPNLDLVVITQDLGVLTTNAKQILETVKQKCAMYKAENYSEANIAEAKRDKAELNAAADKMNAERLRLEREWMEPFSEFKDTANEIVSTMKAASKTIDSVVKTVEDREKTEKKALIKGHFDELKTDLLTFEQVFKPEWLNKGAKVKDIQAEIAAKIEKTRADLVVLDRIGEADAKAFYLKTLDLEAALKKADELKADRARLEKIEAARKEPIPAATQVAPPPAPAAPEAAPIPEPAQDIVHRTFRVWGSKAQLGALASFMAANMVGFEKVEE
jgi:hypothetical protein